MTAPTQPSSTHARTIADHMAREDFLELYRDGMPDYKRVAEFAKLSKEDLSRISGVSKASVRFDAKIPAEVAERLHEIANIANLVAEFFKGDRHKVQLWFELSNPMLGGISPRTLIRAGRYKKLLNFVLEARDAEQASADMRRRAHKAT